MTLAATVPHHEKFMDRVSICRIEVPLFEPDIIQVGREIRMREVPRLIQQRPQGDALKSERCSVAQAATIPGTPERTVQDMAARGELPGAAKFRRRWTFDLEKLRRHVRQKERQAWQTGEKLHPDVTGAALPSGAVLRSMAGKSDGRFTQVIQRLRGQGTKRDGTG